MDLRQLEKEVTAWHKEKFPLATKEDLLFKLVEEVGELFEAALREKQNPNREIEFQVKQSDALGDIVIVLAAFAGRLGYVLDLCVQCSWNEVRTRQMERLLSGED
jgi:NTP pyrophosphatase (non-canonical NTP hydrolase)